MVDLDCMVKLLHLAWLKRIFNAQGSTWKNHLRYILKGFFQALSNWFAILHRVVTVVVRGLCEFLPT